MFIATAPADRRRRLHFQGAAALGKLEKASLVGRRVGKTDRRRRTLALTPAGERMLERLTAPAQRVMERQMSAFKPRERAQFLAILEKFAGTFNESTRVPLEA